MDEADLGVLVYDKLVTEKLDGHGPVETDIFDLVHDVRAALAELLTNTVMGDYFPDLV